MEGTIICFGDSNTYGFDPAGLTGDCYPENECWTGILKALTGCRVINLGVCGRRIPYGSHMDMACGFAESWAREKAPVRVLIMLGTNDLLLDPGSGAENAGKRMEVFLRSLLSTHASASGGIGIILIVPPVMKRGTWVTDDALIRESVRLGEVYAALAFKLGTACIRIDRQDIPMSFDGVHMTREGHRRMAYAVAKEL